MDPPSSYTAPRAPSTAAAAAAAPATGLPRPLSKLPQSRLPSLRPTSTQLPRPSSPDTKRQSQQFRQSIAKPPTSVHRTTNSVASSRLSIIRPPSSGLASSQRQPLSPSSRPQSRHDSAITGLDVERYTRQKPTNRHASQQENAYQLLDSPEESDGSTTGWSESTAPSPVRAVKRPPRPSLSDRTVESLSSIPPSPAANQRRSSFFNPQSPMTPSRPGSAMSYSAVPKLNYGIGARDGGFVRPVSPSKRPGSSGIPMTPGRPTPGRKSISSALPKSSIPGMGASPHKRAGSVVKPRERPPSAAATERTIIAQTPNSSRIGNAKQRPMSMQVPPSQPLTAIKPRTLMRPANSAAKVQRPVAAAEARPVKQEAPPAAEEPAKSSANLRAQIAKAKAAYRESSTKTTSQSPSTYSFEDCQDPFNQGGELSPLEKRVDAARRDGRLNIAALGLKRIPDEVLRMYDADAMEASSVPWNETVDLVRFNAADNQIDEVQDSVLPDVSLEEASMGEDAKGNQFGGIEALDLHGNLLKTMPMGLRRLEQLTVLNLSRNKIENGIFDVLQHIAGLRELHLNDNELTRDVPDSIGQLTNLEVLNLQNNKLSNLPGSVRNLVKLRIVNLSSNRFAELPIGSLFSLPSLREVHVASNALTGAFFPMTVDIVRSLQILDISNNSLASLSFGAELHLPAIQVMNISRNRLFALPNVSSWSSLLTLLVEENGLSALPDGFTSLKKLRVADFKMNSLRAIDPEVANMDALETFAIAPNPLREKKLLTMGAAEIKQEMRKKLDTAVKE